jgi:tetratricopeptide (TPR) repeat protein
VSEALSGQALELKQAGNRALAKRDYETAERAFRQVIERAPDSPEGYLGLTKTLERTHRQSEAIAILEPVHPKSAGILKALGDAYRVLANRGDDSAVGGAIDHYEALRKVRPDAVSLYYLGELYREHRRDFDRALNALKASLELDPKSATVLAAATACARALDRVDEIEDFKGLHKNSTNK